MNKDTEASIVVIIGVGLVVWSAFLFNTIAGLFILGAFLTAIGVANYED